MTGRLGRLEIRLTTLRFVVEGVVGMLTAATATHSDTVSLGNARAYPAYVGIDPVVRNRQENTEYEMRKGKS